MQKVEEYVQSQIQIIFDSIAENRSESDELLEKFKKKMVYEFKELEIKEA